MEVIINDIEDLKEYLHIDEYGKRIYFVFDTVTFNCAVPGNWHFDYTFSNGTSTDYYVEILAKNITFNYFANFDYILAKFIRCTELSCNQLHVDNSICGDKITAYMLFGNKIKSNYLSVVYIDCREVDAKDTYINYKHYHRLKANNIRTLEEEDIDKN